MALLLLACLVGGKGSYDFEFAERNIRVWTYEPRAANANSPVVVVMHGMLRSGQTYRDSWVNLADRYRCVILAPEFSQEEWPGSRWYNHGGIRDERGHDVPEEKWAFSAIDAVFDDYCKSRGNRSKRYFLFGHSAGGQFVHRMALLKPDAKYEMAVAANAGCYSWPDAEIAWPYGLGKAPIEEAQLKRIFARRLVVLLGDQDTDPNHPQLAKNPEAMAQGKHRLERGRNFFEAAKAKAAALGAKFGWKLETVRGVAHDGDGMAHAAAKLMFGR